MNPKVLIQAGPTFVKVWVDHNLVHSDDYPGIITGADLQAILSELGIKADYKWED